MNFVVATIKPWNISAYQKHISRLPGNWTLIQEPADLTLERLMNISPRYVFFPHWSWVVPEEIISRFECVAFHMSDVPYGRGGSPLQNLIQLGHKMTMLTALQMVSELDAGPVYGKRAICLQGNALEIYERMSHIVFEMVEEILLTAPTPIPQVGNPTLFKRRVPSESKLPFRGSSESLYDFIRMLDAPTYPRAYLEWGELRLEFSDARLKAGKLMVTAEIIQGATDQE